MPATTIDEVIKRLEAIMAECGEKKDSAGYFAALYYCVTCRVREGIINCEFQDNARMERLDVIFANRYLTAYDQWRNGQQPSASWATAFEATKKKGTIVLQHLLAGMNAHINLDLGIAAVETMNGGDIHLIRSDFYAINTILAAMVYEVIKDLNQVSPLLSLLGMHATSNNEMLINFTIDNARDGAWCFAEDLAAKTVGDYRRCIDTRDGVINGLATNITHPSSRMFRFTLWLVHLFEWKNTKKIIEVLIK